MSKHRKTVDVAYLITECNKLLRLTTVSDDFRNGVSAVLEGVLHHTGNYEGFNYVGFCEEGGFQAWRKDAGAYMKEIGSEYPLLSTIPYLGNETRRFYYTNRKLPSCGQEALVSSTFSLPTLEANDLLYPKRKL